MVLTLIRATKTATVGQASDSMMALIKALIGGAVPDTYL